MASCDPQAIRTYIPLFPEWLSEKMCTQQSQKVIGYDQYTVPDDCSCRTYFCCFPLTLQTHFHGLSCQFFQISLKKRELKTTHNAFQDCRVHFSQQPFSKKPYIVSKGQV